MFIQDTESEWKRYLALASEQDNLRRVAASNPKRSRHCRSLIKELEQSKVCILREINSRLMEISS